MLSVAGTVLSFCPSVYRHFLNRRSMSTLIDRTIAFVKTELSGNDASHDYWHIERVWNLAKQIAIKEGVKDTEVVELSALLHDIRDWKYSGSETAGVEAAGEFLRTQGFEESKIQRVVYIIENVSFKNELAKKVDGATKNEGDIGFPLEAAIVQDADRLDAIGAIGIARTFSYSGAKNRPMHDPSFGPRLNLSKAEYMQPSPHNTTINHFYEKLFLLKDMMKTKTGKELALARHTYMVEYVKQFFNEWEGYS